MSFFIEREECRSCYGAGQLDRNRFLPKARPVMEACSSCLGIGVELTDIGRELVEFVAEYFDLKPKAKP